MVTRLDIARRAGVSTATISRVMNNTDLVSSKLRDKVIKAVEELEYRPNLAAKSLKTHKNYNIGYLIPDISNPYYTEIYKGLNNIAYGRGYICALLEMQFKNSKANVDLNRYDGLVITTDFINDITGANINMDIPVVVLAENTLELPLENYAFVNHSMEEVMMETIAYLFGLGHRDIGMIICDLPSSNREHIYRKTLEKHGLEFKEERVVRYRHPNYSYFAGSTAMEELIARKTGVTAVLTQNDLVAIGAMSVARLQGIRIPEDISFLGCDDTVAARYSNPALSTIKLYKERQGEKAAQLLFELIDGKRPDNYEFKAQLLLRESTGKQK